MSDKQEPFNLGDRVVMIATEANEGDPPDGTVGVITNIEFSSVPQVRWDDWTNHRNDSEWYVTDLQITRVVSPP